MPKTKTPDPTPNPAPVPDAVAPSFMASSGPVVPAGHVASEVVPEPPHSAALAAGLKSLLITGSSVLTGFVVVMFTDPMANLHDAHDALLYTQHHILGFIIATVLAPAWRASSAYKVAQDAKKEGQ